MENASLMSNSQLCPFLILSVSTAVGRRSPNTAQIAAISKKNNFTNCNEISIIVQCIFFIFSNELKLRKKENVSLSYL